MRQKLVDLRPHQRRQTRLYHRYQFAGKHIDVLVDGRIDRLAQQLVAAKQVGQLHPAPLVLELEREPGDVWRLVDTPLRIECYVKVGHHIICKNRVRLFRGG